MASLYAVSLRKLWERIDIRVDSGRQPRQSSRSPRNDIARKIRTFLFYLDYSRSRLELFPETPRTSSRPPSSSNGSYAPRSPLRVPRTLSATGPLLPGSADYAADRASHCRDYRRKRERRYDYRKALLLIKSFYYSYN